MRHEPPHPRPHEDKNGEAGFPAAAAVRPTGGELATCLNVRIASPIYVMVKCMHAQLDTQIFLVFQCSF